MRDPNLRSDFFVQDRVLARELLLAYQQFVRLQGAVPEENTVAFSGSGRLALELQPPAHDLSHFNRFSLICRNYTDFPLLVGMKLVHGPDSPMIGADVSFSGGRAELPPGNRAELFFPAQCFGTYGMPAGWSDVRKIEIFFAFEKDHIGSREIRVSIESVHGELLETHHGPRLTEAGLVAVLRKNLPSTCLGNYGHKTLLKSLSPARRLLLRVPPPHPYPRETADEILNGRIMGRCLSFPPAWDANPLGIQEWTHFLNRHHFLQEPVAALMETGSARYAEALDECIASWIRAEPIPLESNGGAGPSWETLSAAWRLREWLWVTRIVRHHPAFSDQTRRAMARSIWEHCRHLMDHRGHPNNWIIVESAALTLAGLSFPEFEEADDWVKTGLERLIREFDRQFWDDGVHYEISPLYHAVCAHAVLEVHDAYQTAGQGNSPFADHRLERSFEYLAALCRPDFTWPSLNDSGSINGDYTALMKAAGFILQRPDFTWIGTQGTQGSPPEKTAGSFSDAGIAMMRSHYGPDAHFLVFRAGPAGAAHIHDDVLSIETATFGKPRLVDPGISTYAPDRLSDYYRSATAHSVVITDGKEFSRSSMPYEHRIRPAGSDLSCWSDGALEYAVGAFRKPGRSSGETMLTRTVVFVRHAYWVVRDEVEGIGEHEIAVYWQFAPARFQVHPDTSAAFVIDGTGHGLGLIPVRNHHKIELEKLVGSCSPFGGWVSLNGGDVPAFTLRYRFYDILPFTQEWLLLPFSGRGSTDVSVTREQHDNTVILRITFPHRAQDTVVLPGSRFERESMNRTDYNIRSEHE